MIQSVHQSANMIPDENEENEEIFEINNEKFEITSKCTEGHILQLRTKDPNGYGKS